MTHYPEAGDGQVVDCDVVVVGSGAGGAAAAKELAEDGRDVVVLEEGGYHTVDEFHGPPVRRFQAMGRDAGTTQIWGSPPIPLPLGRAIGGTTIVNSGTCWRAPDKVLRRWGSEFGVDDADPETMRPYFERVERIQNIRPVPRELWGRNAELTHEGVMKLGLSGGPLLRGITDCHGCGTCAMGCPTNAKQAVHLTYLPLAQRAGARIFAHTRAERVLADGGRAMGVVATLLDPRTEDPRGELIVRAPIVVVACGTIHTPVLLRRSGLAGRSGQLGRNLRIHPAIGVAGVYGEDVSSWRGTLQPYFVDTLFDSHDVMLETTAAHPAISAGSLPGIGLETKQMLTGFRNVASIGLYVSDTSSGRVRTLPGMREPVMTYRLNETDFRKLCAGVKLAAEIHFAAGAMMVLSGIAGLPALTTPDDAEQIVSGNLKPSAVRPTAFHPMGTARMGRPGESVVGPWGEHHDVRNLFVADGSLFPTCVAVNPQVSIMAFASRTADHISRTR